MDKKPILVFDLDGTLVETAPDLLDSLNYCLQRQNIEAISLQDLRKYIGHGGHAMIAHALEANGTAYNAALAEKMLADFMDYYAAHIPGKSHYFKGAREALQRFSEAGFVFAVCTNKAEKLARQLIEALQAQANLPCPFAAIRGGDSFAWKKPDPRHIFSVIAEAGGDEKRALMIGDSSPDIMAARAGNLPSIACRFGYSDVPPEKLGANAIINSYDELTVEMVERLIKDNNNIQDTKGLTAGA